jgi:hypothetical protein
MDFNIGTICKDAITICIDWFIIYNLKKAKAAPYGWDVLDTDPFDNRLWELVDLQGELPGGGPPALIHLAMDKANKKYGPGV